MCVCVCVCVHPYHQQTGHQSGMVANSARGQLNGENGICSQQGCIVTIRSIRYICLKMVKLRRGIVRVYVTNVMWSRVRLVVVNG